MEVLRVGIDIGSTTVKIVVVNDLGNILFKEYRRHFSDVKTAVKNLLYECEKNIGQQEIKIVITGSGGLSLSEELGIEFVQEVIACTKTVEELIPQTDVAIELGGEDAKITYFGESMEQRMNGSCAGGTGAFIDQMATLMKTDAEGLNELAKGYKVIYPIASRCGVFAKTDIQPLINEGALKEDIAASIFQAVVNQTISGLACGKPIRGKVAFLGGPLYFISSLRQRFIETLGLKDEDVIFPENSQLFVAMGAAYLAGEQEKSPITVGDLIYRISAIHSDTVSNANVLQPLFADEEELKEFRVRHGRDEVKKAPLEEQEGNLYLGMDAGSTTSKVAVINENGELVYSYYNSNEGEPLDLCISILKDLYQKLPPKAKIVQSAITGYGEKLIQAALKIDIGEVETIAHYKAAKHFAPNVNFIIDIGGQDMKAIRIKDGVVDSILLNEACSSGCGSFIESFAHSLNMPVRDFAKEALLSQKPINLGSRCTVFMNSKVKQSQKEGATLSDISAGLSYSVIKNALYKVIKLRNPETLGKNVVAQGGTFYNEAVLRAFELETGVNVIRPDIAGIMGAFGAALIAKERYQPDRKTVLLGIEELDQFKQEKTFRHCGLCANNCLLTVTNFEDGRQFISGNRCERGAGQQSQKEEQINLFKYKYDRIFRYKPLSNDKAKRGKVGIPRVLNMYENYPLWHTIFTELGFQVILSPKSNKKVYNRGIESIPSEAACYPAKMVHGHIQYLIDIGVPFIFYPAVNYELKEFDLVGNHYNCPVVNSYPEVIKNNMEDVAKVNYANPFINLNSEKSIEDALVDCLKNTDLTRREIRAAIEKGMLELFRFKNEIRRKGEEVLEYLDKENKKGIVLCGRPYHIDPEINHGMTEIITAEGFAVLTEDSVAHMGILEEPLRVVDQWTYHSRLYRAASVVSRNKNLELIQLTSFGCGLDAVTSDQVAEILEKKNKLYTLIKIDEGSNLGAVRIRIRSLKASIGERDKQGNMQLETNKKTEKKNVFTKDMKRTHTILCPQMSPVHFQFMEDALKEDGYRLEVLPSVDKQAVDEGLKYVNNDACFPSIIVIGQMMAALKSGKYDLKNTSLILSQTGGACRATNYIAFLKKALKDAGMEQIPVISLNASGLEENPGFKLTLKTLNKVVIGMLYGDLFMNVLYNVRPYEKVAGSANRLYDWWIPTCKHNVRNGNLMEFKKNVREIVKDFDNLALVEKTIPKVGIVGEILVKFHPTANNQLVEEIEKEGAQVIMPELMNFFLYSLYNQEFKSNKLGMKKSVKFNAAAAIKIIEMYRKPMREALKASKRFEPPVSIQKMALVSDDVVSRGNQAGEGWLLTAEMLELVRSGVNNIVCVQPFACLPNHITGRGAIKRIKNLYPKANIVAIDYDPGASEVNQINRIKLMLTNARKNLYDFVTEDHRLVDKGIL